MVRLTEVKVIRLLKNSIVHLVLIAGSIIMIMPLIWMISTSLKLSEDILVWPPKFIPGHITLGHYIKVLKDEYFPRYFLNSLFVSVIGTFSILFTSSIAGFVFAKYNFTGKGTIFALIIATLMVPIQVYMVPLYIIMSRMKWVDTYMGIIVPVLIGSFGIFFMRQNISAIPDDLIDCGRIDGLSEFQIFIRIILPLSQSAIGALSIFTFITMWGYFIWPLIITNSQKKYVLEIGLTMFQYHYYIDYGLTMAASTLALLPVMLAFFIFRKRIIEGVTLTGLKY